jgi:hypothetical protein
MEGFLIYNTFKFIDDGAVPYNAPRAALKGKNKIKDSTFRGHHRSPSGDNAQRIRVVLSVGPY